MTAHVRNLLLLVSTALTGCSEFGLGRDGQILSEAEPEVAEDFEGELLFEVLPAPGLRGDVDLPTQTFRELVVEGADLEFTLEEPVELTGTVTGYVTTPWVPAAQIPGGTIPLEDALVSTVGEWAQHATNDLTALDGSFAIDLVANAEYRVSVVPSDPLVPFRTETLFVADDTVHDVDLAEGVSVWGTVTDEEGDPLPGVAVYAVNSFGTAGAVALTSAEGWYVIKVEPGTYALVCEGRSSGRDPILTDESISVTEDGLEHDFVYASLDFTLVSGRVVDEQGDGVAGVTARFVASSLDGYTDSAVHEITATTNADGNFDAQLLPGSYDVEYFPSPADPLSGVVASLEVGGEELDLEAVALEPVVPVQGIVLDAEGMPVADALISAEEVGLGQRSWDGYADANGQFWLLLPRTDVRIAVTPPYSRTDISTTIRTVSIAEQQELTIAMETGTLFGGHIQYRTEDDSLAPAEYCLVTVRTESGTTLGSAVTGADGQFALRVQLQE